MISTRITRVSAVTLALAAGAGSPLPSALAEDKAVLRLSAFAVNMTAPGAARAGTIDLTIERWSTEQEHDQLRDALIEKGPDALLAALQKIKPRAGYIRSSTSLGWNIQFARESTLPDGARRVVVATDRPMSFWELRNQRRSVEYEFTLAEVRLNKDGKGQGKLVPAAKITWNKETRTVEIENWGIEPVRLTEVRVAK